MAAFLVDKRDQLFVLNEMLKVDKLCEFEKFAEYTGCDLVLTEAHRFAKNEFYPTLRDGDRQGCVYDSQTHNVKFPDSFKKPYEKFREGGWLSMCDSPGVGGEGFPLTIGTAVSEIFYASGFYIYGAAELSHAGAKVIEKYGTEVQKDLYMTRLFSGEWMGSMCLTEPDAGSDVGKVKTSAALQPDGTYTITGTKIFITAGEHDLTKNIIHMVLARVDGDPPGTKGLSLFIVPKFLSDENGQIIKRNDVKCMGIEHKMGLHGLATCTLVFGDSDSCTAYLLGSRCKGIVEMFCMMNEQRLLVGLQGLSYSSAAFLHAVEYTKIRKQGFSVYSDKRKKGSVAIIEHPDIKRMLLILKAHVEGGRALAYFTSMCIDYASVTESETRFRWQGLVEMLTPIVKAYLSNNAWEDTGMAIQCAGGYGYCQDYPFERLARDCKVCSIYEGTNGIQAIDLVFRKILANRSENFNHLMAFVNKTIHHAKKIKKLTAYANSVQQIKQDLEHVVQYFVGLSYKGSINQIYAKASLFLEVMGEVVFGWLHLWQLTIIYEKLAQEIEDIEQIEQSEIIKIIKNKKNLTFFYGKICSGEFYIETLLRRTEGKLKELESSSDSIINIFENAYTS